MSQLLDPNYNRASILPLGRHKQTGKLSLAVPGIAADLLSALMLPGDVYHGNVLMNDPATGRTNIDVIKRSADLAGAMTLGAGAVPAQGTLRMGLKAPYRPTETGWTFKDVAQPHKLMDKGDWRRVTYATENGTWDEVELPIRSLNATQSSVNPDFAASKSSEGTLPLVIKKGGQFFVQDGHHRLTKAAVNEGKQTAKVRLIDLDGTTQREFPLIDKMQ